MCCCSGKGMHCCDAHPIDAYRFVSFSLAPPGASHNDSAQEAAADGAIACDRCEALLWVSRPHVVPCVVCFMCLMFYAYAP